MQTSAHNAFLRADIVSENDDLQRLLILPDSGNRARCIMSYEVYKHLFPTKPIERYNEKISTAKSNNYLEIVGHSKEKFTFLFAQGSVEYTVRPLIAKKLQLPCLFSMHDLQKLKLRVDYATKTVEFGNGQTDRLVTDDTSGAEVVTTLLYKERINAMEEVLLPVQVKGQSNEAIPILIEPIQELWNTYQLTAMPSVNMLTNQGIGHIKVYNLNDHPMELKCGTTVGTASIAQVELNKQMPQRLTEAPEMTRERLNKEFRLPENTELSPTQRK